MKHRRQCCVCACELYDDEPGRYCSDCRTVCERLHELHIEFDECRQRPPGHEQRIEQHAQRVGAEIVTKPEGMLHGQKL